MTDSDGKYEEKIPVRADGTRPRRRGQQEATSMRVLSLEFYLHFSQFDGRKWPDGLLQVNGEVLRKSIADWFTQQNRIMACLMHNTIHFHFITFVRVAT